MKGAGSHTSERKISWVRIAANMTGVGLSIFMIVFLVHALDRNRDNGAQQASSQYSNYGDPVIYKTNQAAVGHTKVIEMRPAEQK